MSDREERPEGPPGEDLGATALGDSLPGGSATIAGLRIEGEIARGGMGIVYKAFDPQLRRWVAVKVISPLIADDDEFRRRFIAESRAVAALDSDRIVPIYNAGEEDGQLFQVTRFIAGGDLASALKKEGPFPPEEVVRVISQIADALDTAHRKGAIHRDVKPKNILVDREGPEPRYYLTDFGLTKPLAATSGMTATGQILGTVDYMAPELIENGAIDGRVDVYALGCVAVELLTGYPPFHRDSKQAILIAHLHADPALPDNMDEGLRAVLSRALSKDPDARYHNCGDFARDIATEVGFPGDPSGNRRTRASSASFGRLLKRGMSRRVALVAASLLGLTGVVFLATQLITLGGSSANPLTEKLTSMADQNLRAVLYDDAEGACALVSTEDIFIESQAQGISKCERAFRKERSEANDNAINPSDQFTLERVEFTRVVPFDPLLGEYRQAWVYSNRVNFSEDPSGLPGDLATSILVRYRYLMVEEYLGEWRVGCAFADYGGGMKNAGSETVFPPAGYPTPNACDDYVEQRR